jgi:RNase P/RNase MRP subunit POP5
MPKINTDVLFMADHFVMVTTIITDYSPDTRDVETAAWKRLADEYGDEWVASTKSFIKQVSIEVIEESGIPTPGDPEDAGIDRD